jgi:two-component system cell cycle sensor histidine kinase/response regulator CckA
MTHVARSLADVDAAAFDLLPDCVFGWGTDHRIIFWNRAAEALYGFTRAEALRCRPAELLLTHFPMPLIEMIEQVAETGRWEGELLQRAKAGRELTVESRWVAQFDGQHRLTTTIAVERENAFRIEDFTSREREHVRGRLHNAQRLESIGQLAGGIAHDFNNMLAIIINYAALVDSDLRAIQRTSSDPRIPSMRKDLAEIQLAAERAARLTHQLLSFSRQNLASPTAVDVNDCVRDVEELLRRTLGEQVDLEIALADDLHPIHADPAGLDHALVNLAVNSRDAMPNGGTLRIDTANVEISAEYAALRPELLPGRYVRLRVSDTGVGMTPDVLGRAFDPFFTTKPVGEGTGLGLATVFGIIRQARGRVRFHSEPGVGTTFTAMFPVALDQPVAESAPVAAPLDRVETILLVEDEAALREVTRRILNAAGYAVLAAADGPAAIALAVQHQGSIDLVLTDVVMPGMLGHHLADRLRELRPSIRVLFMSGFAGPVIDGAVATHCDGLIEKPFTAPGLLERIATA